MWFSNPMLYLALTISMHFDILKFSIATYLVAQMPYWNLKDSTGHFDFKSGQLLNKANLNIAVLKFIIVYI